MTIPLLIDTDMGIDDAVAIALALASDRLALPALVSVGGNVSLEQATTNLGRLLTGFEVADWPALGRGLDQSDAALERAHHVFHEDGLGGTLPPDVPNWKRKASSFESVYQDAAKKHEKQLVIIAIGPLTNLAALIAKKPDVLKRAGRIVVMGGAVWCPGNITPDAEFNIYRDPAAAAAVFASGLPITVVPLDVTRQVAIDASHTARLARSGTRAGDLLARMIQFPMENHPEAGAGRFLVHDALTIGLLLWPELFMQTHMGLEVITSGPRTGKTKPTMQKDKSHQLTVVISVNAVDLLENMLELLCHEHFIV